MISCNTLTSKDSRIHKHVLTAFFKLSIYNKILIMAAKAVDNIFEVLESGKTMEARTNVTAEIYSLCMIGDCKVQIGVSSKALSALVGILKESAPIGKIDAATALFNLVVYNPNKILTKVFKLIHKITLHCQILKSRSFTFQATTKKDSTISGGLKLHAK
uniref:Ubiquitin-protein ligase, related n=1 Tax=Medicago truncatula TaxID=3880 RepID=A2Q4A0_MEDTR|nr:ubiquitin-protein ligase, related [Medicago truncatula]